MKAYLFDMENGLYQGETFVTDDTFNCDEGMTRVEPPPHVTGHVPVFDPGRQAWEVLAVEVFKERNYCAEARRS